MTNSTALKWKRYETEELASLVGQSFDAVEIRTPEAEAVWFSRDGDPVYTLCHEQECCEDVYIEDVSGDLEWLTRAPILEARRETSEGDPSPPEDADADSSWTWTFFVLSTIKGTVKIRFFGSSNGFYGEDADLYARSVS